MIFRGKKVLNWSLNNYLGLANHPDIRKTDAESAAKWGLAYPMGARKQNGESDISALSEGFASITPIMLDMTAHASLQSLKTALKDQI